MAELISRAPEALPSPEYDLHTMRHSASHVMAIAVLRLYPDAQLATGPAITTGFYYDIKFPQPISSYDLPRIQEEMEKVKAEAIPFVREEVSLDEADEIMADRNQPYKTQLIDFIRTKGDTSVVDEGLAAPGQVAIPETVSLYRNGDEFVDLCRGPHVDNTSQIGAFKLDAVSAAHWRTNKGIPQLTRIYGISFNTETELQDYLAKRELAKENDHRKLGKELKLFAFSPEVGPGLPLWLPNGGVWRAEVESLIYREQARAGYERVYSPHIGRKSLWERSGHWDLYREKMYSPMDIEGEEYLVKPMTCPIHCEIYNALGPHSYRDLPIRLGEIASVYRYEQSGELHGLMRDRAFTQDDAHLFMRPDQVVDEFVSVFDLTRFLVGKLGFDNYRIRIGIRSDTEKYLGNDEGWEVAQQKITEAVNRTGVEYFVKPGDAAFYGPKADFLLTDALGREWQCGTVQVDFMLPEEMDLWYTDENGQQVRPVMIHRAPLGSLERFLGVMLENNGGNFPTWLAPVQVKVIPISEKHLAYAKQVTKQLKDNDLRVELDEDNEKLGKKIRNGKQMKIPYLLVVGDTEANTESVSINQRGQDKSVSMPVADFTKGILAEIADQRK